MARTERDGCEKLGIKGKEELLMLHSKAELPGKECQGRRAVYLL
jgi:hypothetical protein